MLARVKEVITGGQNMELENGHLPNRCKGRMYVTESSDAQCMDPRTGDYCNACKSIYDRDISISASDRKQTRITICGVKIGDRFTLRGKNVKAKVLDILEKKSLLTGNTVGYICLAESEGLSTNTFEVPFSTVVRNRISP
jgi:K+-transporting ATPase c subunit